MKNYIKENYTTFNQFITDFINANPMLDEAFAKQYRNGAVSMYIDFLYNLTYIKNYSHIDSNSPLKAQSDFIDKLIKGCESYKEMGSEFFNSIDYDKFNNWWDSMIEDWFHNMLDKDLYSAEKEFYSKIAYLDEPIEQSNTQANFLQNKKQEAMSVLRKHKSNNLG